MSFYIQFNLKTKDLQKNIEIVRTAMRTEQMPNLNYFRQCDDLASGRL